MIKTINLLTIAVNTSREYLLLQMHFSNNIKDTERYTKMYERD
jgi:hypothetical protein